MNHLANTEKLKPSPSDKFKLWLGKSTGLLSKISKNKGMVSNQNIALSQEDASKHILIMSGSGSGKTIGLINPLLMQLVDQDCGGLIFDIRGNFHRSVSTIFEAANRIDRLKIVAERGISFNLIEGLDPETAASFLKSALRLSDSSPIDDCWLDVAWDLFRNVLGVLYISKEHYNLRSLHRYLFDAKHREMINKAAQKAEEAKETEKEFQALEESQQRRLNSYRKYYDDVFSQCDQAIQIGVLAKIKQILSPFSHPTIADLFCKHSDGHINEILEGAVYLVTLPLSDWGLCGKVIYNLIKLRFFNLMQQRKNKLDWNQDRPVFFMCNDYQEIVSANRNELSDLNFWDVARDSKTIGIISIPYVKSLYTAIRDMEAANTLLKHFRQKIIYRTEDPETLDLLNQLIKNIEVKNHSVDRQSKNFFSNATSSVRGYLHSKSESAAWPSKPTLSKQKIRALNENQAIAILTIAGNSFNDILKMAQIHF